MQETQVQSLSGTACTVASADLICVSIDSLGPSPSVPLMALASNQ